ncbi:hypothetical protein ACET3Z_019675 [Daucus carota]
MKLDETKLVKNFIWAHNYWVKKDILEKLNIGDESVIQEALDQIHSRSLMEKAKESRKTYRSTLMEDHGEAGLVMDAAFHPRKEEEEWHTVSYKKRRSVLPDKNKRDSVTTIFLHNIPDDSTGKVLPMEFSSSPLKEEEGEISRCNGNKDTSVKEEVRIQVGGEQQQNEHEQRNDFQDQAKEVYQNDSPEARSIKTSLHSNHSVSKQNSKDKFRNNQSSSDISSDATQMIDASSKSEICAPEMILSLQTDLCTDVCKKLKVKSNRGRPKKIISAIRNPFEIGIKFKNKRKKGGGGRSCVRPRGKQNAENCLHMVPLGLTGKTVQEALEIISSAENMGLVIKGDREKVIMEIAKQLETGVL